MSDNLDAGVCDLECLIREWLKDCLVILEAKLNEESETVTLKECRFQAICLFWEVLQEWEGGQS